jgi:hypothetical protein
MQQRRVQHGSADVVEIEIDPVGAGPADGVDKVGVRLVVDDRIQAQFIGEPARFSVPPVMPTTWQASMRAICAAICPTPPAAADTSTRSPGVTAPISRIPK